MENSKTMHSCIKHSKKKYKGQLNVQRSRQKGNSRTKSHICFVQVNTQWIRSKVLKGKENAQVKIQTNSVIPSKVKSDCLHLGAF